MQGADVPLEGPDLTEAISAAMIALYARVYDHDRTSAITYINEDVVVCILKDILTSEETRLVAEGLHGAVIDKRVAFQTETEDEFTAAIERLTQRRVVAFMSANQTSPGIASELFFLEPRDPAEPAVSALVDV
ncbi:DUF2294 family protein [Baekduia soli]|uniref:DUF2294 family protein n=1 Tax=Baekduia soli TaxID=496014 RepID=A0A5B8U7X7_9ACTN|nr:Na-translocating system protein MpsC family protein [Baekduia soli]QEC49216.1 DUF2294 family protein [Baekduia soli]